MEQYKRNNAFNYGLITHKDAEILEQTLEYLSSKFDTIDILEIGIGDGDTAKGIKHFVENILNKKLNYSCVDLKQMIPFFENCKCYSGYSDEIFMNIHDKFNFIIIDGCHCVNHVAIDFLNFQNNLIVGGVMAFHDTSELAQGRDYQEHGPKTIEFHISVLKGLENLGLLNNKRNDYKKIFESSIEQYDGTKTVGGGYIMFEKIG